MQSIVLINKSRTIWPTKISMPFWGFKDNFLWDACFVFDKCVEKLNETSNMFSSSNFQMKERGRAKYECFNTTWHCDYIMTVANIQQYSDHGDYSAIGVGIGASVTELPAFFDIEYAVTDQQAIFRKNPFFGGQNVCIFLPKDISGLFDKIFLLFYYKSFSCLLSSHRVVTVPSRWLLKEKGFCSVFLGQIAHAGSHHVYMCGLSSVCTLLLASGNDIQLTSLQGFD